MYSCGWACRCPSSPRPATYYPPRTESTTVLCRSRWGPCTLQASLEELAGGRGLKDLLGLCVGAFVDRSTDLDWLIKALALSRVLYLSRESGRPLSDKNPDRYFDSIGGFCP